MANYDNIFSKKYLKNKNKIQSVKRLLNSIAFFQSWPWQLLSQ
jgi:hypothetical protein